METKEIMGTTIASRGPVVDITSLGREILLRKVKAVTLVTWLLH